MSLTINIYYTGPKGNALKFIKEMINKGILEQIRKEKGNIRYEYFMPIEDPNTILLIDEWESKEALDLHHQSLMMQQIIKLREKYHLKMKVQKYQKYI